MNGRKLFCRRKGISLGARCLSLRPLLTAWMLPFVAQAGPVEDKLAALETAAKNAQMAGDNAWMLTSSAVVLMMTGPGLALFYVV